MLDSLDEGKDEIVAIIVAIICKPHPLARVGGDDDDDDGDER